MQNVVRHLLRTLVTVLVFLSATGWCQHPQKPTKPLLGELKVTYEYPNYSLPFLVALDKGFFLKEGVKVIPIKLTSGSSDISSIDVINGHDFYLLNEGRGTVLAVHFFSRKEDFAKGMIVKKSADIFDWKDFKGKSVVITDIKDFSLLNDVFAEHGLKAHGTEGRDVTIQAGGGAVGSFPKDQNRHALYGSPSIIIPFMRQYPEEFELRWKDLGKKQNRESPLVACSYVKASLLPEKKKVVRAYLKAIDCAIDLIREDPKAAITVLPKYFNVDKEWAHNMAVFDFHKSDDVVDFTALSDKLGMDVQGCVLDLSEE